MTGCLLLCMMTSENIKMFNSSRHGKRIDSLYTKSGFEATKTIENSIQGGCKRYLVHNNYLISSQLTDSRYI